MLFGGEGQQIGTLASKFKGVSDWANVGRVLKIHNQSHSPHNVAVTKGDNYLLVVTGKQKDISSQLSSLVDQTVERNRHILKAIIDVVVFCGQQNIALRRGTEDKSKYMALLQFRAKTDPIS